MLLPLKWNILVGSKKMKNAKHAAFSVKKSSRAVVPRSYSYIKSRGSSSNVCILFWWCYLEKVLLFGKKRIARQVMCKIHPRRIMKVSQPGICHRSRSVGWPAWNIMENLGQDREKMDHFLPSFPVAESEWQWLSCLQVCAAFKSSVSTSFHRFLWLLSLLSDISGFCAS